VSTASDVEGSGPAVFLQDFVDVDQPGGLVSERLSVGQLWLARLASAAGEEAESQLLGLGPSDHLVTRQVRVRLGRPAPLESGVVVAVRWEDDRGPNLLPLLDGNLEVAPLGPDQSRIVLHASYRPPFDGGGSALDEVLLHRVAESIVRTFLGKVAETLDDWPVEGTRPT
jgi:hypothetical protein